MTHRLPHPDRFVDRHIGPTPVEEAAMLAELGLDSIGALIDQAIPVGVRWHGTLQLPEPLSEREALAELRALADQNRVLRSYIGMGYAGCVTPPVILRNIFENPGWYTQYTPYQPEIAQGRLEAMLNFQTLVIDLTGMEVANSSLLDEATAAAEAMTLCHRVIAREGGDRHRFLVDARCHPQTIAVVRTRAEPLGFQVEVGDAEAFEPAGDVFGVLVQYPDTYGQVSDFAGLTEAAHAAGALVVVATDLLALTLLAAPGEWGADVVVGNSQRFGVPLGYGGPHAAFMATREAYARQLPGRVVGVSVDSAGHPALRLALQTREQHIRRDKATSNICTAQVLLAVAASMYACYHGPDGLTAIAERVRTLTGILKSALEGLGCEVTTRDFFDTLHVLPGQRSAEAILAAARELGINLRDTGEGSVGVALDETVSLDDLQDLYAAFGGHGMLDTAALAAQVPQLPTALRRTTPFLTHPVFHRYHSEHELLRYMHRLETRDLSLTTSMIPLGSCTMKLNATAEMEPVTWPGFADLHPFAPLDQAAGYQVLHARLEAWLREITGFAGCSLQPNAGSQGEYTGLLVIRAYHHARGDQDRNVCLIPISAHGTNPASAALAGMQVVVVQCDADGNIDLGDLRARAAEHADRLAALMVTYPSTHGVFEGTIREICDVIHGHGGQVYLDGANMNAMVGLVRPGDFGADVCHLNLHKTFCIPHGGGGPGMGPICVAEHLAPYLPGHPVVPTGGRRSIGAVSAAPWGSPLILTISYAYIAMMGPEGLRRATEIAILNANYVAHRLAPHYPVLYTGQNGRVAHECILDLRQLKSSAGIEAVDVAKRLMDYGFHAPTMSWPVAGTLMIEPTESESKAELDRFIHAMIGIRDEIRAIEAGEAGREQNLLKLAPHTALAVCADAWDRPYSREAATFPAPWLREHKFWPAVARVNDQYGDRNLVCTCPPLEDYADA